MQGLASILEHYHYLDHSKRLWCMNSFIQLISTEFLLQASTVEDRNEISFCPSGTQNLVNDLPETRIHVKTDLVFLAFSLGELK